MNSNSLRGARRSKISLVIRALTIVAGLLVVVVLAGSTITGATSRRASGKVVLQQGQGYEFWGLKADFRIMDPFAPRQLRFSELPSRYQKIGLRIECRYVMRDIVDSASNWGVVVEPVEINSR